MRGIGNIRWSFARSASAESDAMEEARLRPPAARRSLFVVATLAALALSVGVVVTHLSFFAGGGIKKHPPPALFAAREVAPLGAELDGVAAAATGRTNAWLAAHPRATEDDFVAFALDALPGPPDRARTDRELAELHRLAHTRSSARDAASRWLEKYGKKAVWKLYAKQFASLTQPARGVAAKVRVKDAIALGARLTTEAKLRYARPSPYIADPSLGALNQQKFAGSAKTSYPSKHAVVSYAALGVLSRAEPLRATELDWMAHEVCFARLYGGGHYRSDLVDGASLGAMIAAWELRPGAPA